MTTLTTPPAQSIPILDLTRQYNALKTELEEALIRVASSGMYILGKQVADFETEMATYLGAKHAIGCANGSDALFLALKALKIGAGDEVITTGMSYIATSEAIVRAGARPVFVDIDATSFNMDVAQIEAAITPNTKAILPVHLFGQPADMDAIMAIAQKHGLKVIEDCAQAIGATYKGKRVGTIGDIGCFSFFPSKNLGAMGDGGLMTTNNAELDERMRMLRVHGSRERYKHDEMGINSRLDAMQAAVLSIKLKHLDNFNANRQQAAGRYTALLSELADQVTCPTVAPETSHVFHQYTICIKGVTGQQRTQLQQKLLEAGVMCMIYYPIPLYAQPTHANLGCTAEQFAISERVKDEVLSLPMFPEITEAEQQYVVNTLKACLAAI